MRRLGLGLSFAAMAAFVACSSGSGTGSDPLEDTVKKSSKSTSSDESQEESKSVKKKKRILDDDSNISPSYDNNWPSRVSSIEEAMALDCNAALKCQKVFVEDELVNDYFFCDGKEMRAYSPILDAKECPEDDIPDVSECKVSKDGDKVLVKIVADGITDNMTLTIDDDGVVTEVSKFDASISKADFDKSCKEAKEEDEDVLSTECDESAKTITQTYKEEDVKNVDQLKAMNEFMCDMMLNPEKYATELLEDIEQSIDKANDWDDDDESNRSIADICAEGLSEDCLIGTWTLKSINQNGGEVITDFSSAPGTMEFRDDGIYRYTRSSAGSCPGVDMGEWSVSEDGKTLTFFENKMGDCIEFMTKYTTTPSIVVSGNTVTLKLNRVVFQQDESDGLYSGNDTEVFARIE